MIDHPTPWSVRNLAREVGMKEARPNAGLILVDANGMIIYWQEEAQRIVDAVNAASLREEDGKA